MSHCGCVRLLKGRPGPVGGLRATGRREAAVGLAAPCIVVHGRAFDRSDDGATQPIVVLALNEELADLGKNPLTYAGDLLT